MSFGKEERLTACEGEGHGRSRREKAAAGHERLVEGAECTSARVQERRGASGRVVERRGGNETRDAPRLVLA